MIFLNYRNRKRRILTWAYSFVTLFKSGMEELFFYVRKQWVKAKQVRFSFVGGKANRKVKLLRSKCQKLQERPIFYSLYEYSRRRSQKEAPMNKVLRSSTTTQRV